MIKLFTLPWLAFSRFSSFWKQYLTLLVFTGLGVLMLSSLDSFFVGTTSLPTAGLYTLPEAWVNFAAGGRLFNIFFSFIFVYILAQDFEHSMLRQHLILGLSRTEQLASHLSVAVFFSLLALLPVFLFAVVLGKPGNDPVFGTEQIFVILTYLLQSFILFQLAYTVLLFTEKAMSAIWFLLFWQFMIEPFILGPALNRYVTEKASEFLPMNTINAMLPELYLGAMSQSHSSAPNWESVQLALGYAVLFLIASFLRLKYKDY